MGGLKPILTVPKWVCTIHFQQPWRNSLRFRKTIPRIFLIRQVTHQHRLRRLMYVIFFSKFSHYLPMDIFAVKYRRNESCQFFTCVSVSSNCFIWFRKCEWGWIVCTKRRENLHSSQIRIRRVAHCKKAWRNRSCSWILHSIDTNNSTYFYRTWSVLKHNFLSINDFYFFLEPMKNSRIDHKKKKKTETTINSLPNAKGDEVDYFADD